MISVYKPKFTESGEWEVEIVDVEAREIYRKYFADEKKAKKFYKQSKKKAKKRIVLI